MELLKLFGKIILIVIGILIVFIAVSTLHHKYKLKNEAEKYFFQGKLIEVNNNKMHVYSEGQEDNTLVFMSGHGTSCPTIDFKPLWMKLTEKNRIIIVEKAGYG